MIQILESLTQPQEPISLQTAYAQLKLDIENGVHPEDEWLKKIAIPAARSKAEEFTGLILAQRSLRLTIDGFPAGSILLPPPVKSVDSVNYFDGNGNEVAYTDFRLTGGSLKPVSVWPSGEMVQIVFTSGYSSNEVIPPSLMVGMLLILGHIYKNREVLTDREMFVMPAGAESFLRPSRVNLGMA